MKIGDEVFVHGYVDEMRKDVIIIRNNGGYFGTVEGEIVIADPKVDWGDTSQTEEWHYNEQDSTWYPYNHPEEQQMDEMVKEGLAKNQAERSK